MVALSTALDADTLPLSVTFRKLRQKWNKLAFMAVNQYHLYVLNSELDFI
jgi:SH3 domain protein